MEKFVTTMTSQFTGSSMASLVYDGLIETVDPRSILNDKSWSPFIPMFLVNLSIYKNSEKSRGVL